jgi:hypothetical protein
VNCCGMQIERTKPGSSELPGDANRKNRAWLKWTTGW